MGYFSTFYTSVISPFIVNPPMDHDLMLHFRQLQPELAFRGSHSANNIRNYQRYPGKKIHLLLLFLLGVKKSTGKITHPQTMLKN